MILIIKLNELNRFDINLSIDAAMMHTVYQNNITERELNNINVFSESLSKERMFEI